MICNLIRSNQASSGVSEKCSHRAFDWRAFMGLDPQGLKFCSCIYEIQNQMRWDAATFSFDPNLHDKSSASCSGFQRSNAQAAGPTTSDSNLKAPHKSLYRRYLLGGSRNHAREAVLGPLSQLTENACATCLWAPIWHSDHTVGTLQDVRTGQRVAGAVWGEQPQSRSEPNRRRDETQASQPVESLDQQQTVTGHTRPPPEPPPDFAQCLSTNLD
ncbi:hypothetical protein H4582DRAFT_1442126 [Lactarius indigo]|nr:hypothetical protein H4582DRAFT_1442126 [Lactarius indigo]